MARTLINLPATARRDEIIEVRTMIAHDMETGYRPGPDGRLLPRDLVRRFRCSFDDGQSQELVFATDLFAAVAANPYIAFHVRATSSGSLRFVWEGDNGFSHTETRVLTVA